MPVPFKKKSFLVFHFYFKGIGLIFRKLLLNNLPIYYLGRKSICFQQWLVSLYHFVTCFSRFSFPLLLSSGSFRIFELISEVFFFFLLFCLSFRLSEQTSRNESCQKKIMFRLFGNLFLQKWLFRMESNIRRAFYVVEGRWSTKKMLRNKKEQKSRTKIIRGVICFTFPTDWSTFHSSTNEKKNVFVFFLFIFIFLPEIEIDSFKKTRNTSYLVCVSVNDRF